MQPLSQTARPDTSTAPSQWDYKLDSALRTARFNYGLNDHIDSLMGLSAPLQSVFKAHKTAIAAINKDAGLSDQGKNQKRLQAQQDSLKQIDEFRQKNDKSALISDLHQRQEKKVSDTRSKFRPDNDVLRYLQAQELRDHFADMQQAHERKITITGQTVDSKQAVNPVHQILLAGANAYDIENVPRAREIELVLYSLIDSVPWPKSLIEDGLKDEIALTLKAKLAPVEGAQLQEAKGVAKFVEGLAAETKTLIQEMK